MARPRTDIQPRILKAARARFLHDGVDGASLRDIARDAHTSIGMVSYYFPSKDALFLAVVEEVYGGLTAELERHLAAKKPLRDRLRAIFLRLGQASPEELDVVRLVIREALVSSKRLEVVQPGVEIGTGRLAKPLSGRRSSSPLMTTSWERGEFTRMGGTGLAIARIQAAPMSLTAHPMPTA